MRLYRAVPRHTYSTHGHGHGACAQGSASTAWGNARALPLSLPCSPRRRPRCSARRASLAARSPAADSFSLVNMLVVMLGGTNLLTKKRLSCSAVARRTLRSACSLPHAREGCVRAIAARDDVLHDVEKMCCAILSSAAAGAACCRGASRRARTGVAAKIHRGRNGADEPRAAAAAPA